MTNTKEQAIWKQYPEYPFIEANQFGEVRTKDRYVSYRGGKRLIKGRVLKQQRDRYGYMYVAFRADGKRIHLKTHRIILTCFKLNPDNLPEVNHIDCDPTNNRLDNLEWCTSEYNNAYREKYGVSLNHPVIAVNLKNLEVFYFESQREASRQLSIDRRNIARVVKGEYSQTHDYWFIDACENAVENIRVKFGNKVANEAKKIINLK